MKITLASILVDDQARALKFYTQALGFTEKMVVDMGETAWITVVSPEDPDGPQLSLEPATHPAARPYREALVADGIPWTSFSVDDVRAEHERLVEMGVVFTQEPTRAGPVTTAILDDTCGNLIQLSTYDG